MILEITMGHAPPRRTHKPLTHLDRVTCAYVSGSIDLEDFEYAVGELLEQGREGEVSYPLPPRPPKRGGWVKPVSPPSDASRPQGPLRKTSTGNPEGH